ncbi:MAG: DUF4199 domain-containing protein [Muribaculaceae bacterium]|nr:DUF4199 domain-containing protein [Muribaculaceae bacterium]
MTRDDNIRERSVYSLGAADGAIVGILMGICTLCMVLTVRIQFLSIIGLLLLVVTPFVVWWMLCRSWIKGYCPPTFSAVWLHGICIYLFGSIIMALIFYLSMRYAVPNWIEIETREAAARLAEDPTTAYQAQVLINIIESGQLPSPIFTAVSSIWLVAFTGSLWSMGFAFILTKMRFYRLKREQYAALIKQ